MGLGQMLMALLATVLLSVIILNMNKNSIILESSINEYKVKAIAINLGQTIIDNAQSKRFDENNVAFTAPGSLGPETGENFSNPVTIDDFDDYNNFTNTAVSDTFQIYYEKGKNFPKAVFREKCKVTYVDFNNLNQPVNYTTSYKRLEVCIWSDAYINPFTNKPDTVKLYSICGDWDNP